jgi:hypothetical protein
MASNPVWTLEETVLAFATYQEVGGLPKDKDADEVLELSQKLRDRATSAGQSISDSFRNPAGVFMKLGNLKGAMTDGREGLKFSKRDKEVVDRFRNDSAGLALAASRAGQGLQIPSTDIPEGVPDGFSPKELKRISDNAIEVAWSSSRTGTPLVTPTTMSLAEILNKETDLRIPRHQRSFAWTDDEVGDFVSDVQKASIQVSGGNQEAQHFFGGVVFVRPANHLGWHVIDGQQRLTTFTMALSVLQSGFQAVAERAVAEKEKNTEQRALTYASHIRDDFLWTTRMNPQTGKKEKATRLTLSANDQETYQDLLEGKAVPHPKGSRALLTEARDQLWNNLVAPLVSSQEPSDHMLRALLALQYALLQCCVVIQLAATSSGAAYTLFMVLNDRGMQLSEGDMLRAITLEVLEESAHFDESASLWDEILANPAPTVTAFLRSYYPSAFGSRVDIWRLVDAYRERVFKVGIITDKAKLARHISKQLRGMASDMALFTKLKDASWPYVPPGTGNMAEQQRVARLVKTLKHDLALPLLLAAAGKLSEQDFARLNVLLERFAFRYKNVLGGHAGKASDLYYSEAVRIRKMKAGSSYDMSAFRDSLRDLVEEQADDDLFKQTLLAKLDYERAGQRGNIRWLLASIQDFGPWLNDPESSDTPKLSAAIVLDADSAHIDHIYPQNSKKSDISESLESIKHELGNLVLLEKEPNGLAGNTQFKDKKKFYKESALADTKSLARRKTWTAKSVGDRGQKIAEYAVVLTKL